MTLNQQLCLKRRPLARASGDDFFLSEVEVPALETGEFLVRNEYISIDPAMRGWMNDRRSYFPPVEVGAVMRGLTVGRVVESRHTGYTVGDVVTGMLNLQQFATSNGFQVRKVDLGIAPAPSWLGGLGVPGITAYFGLLEVGQAKAGDTVVVSAAAGAVGSIAGQIAKINGCRVVGIVGSEVKRRFVIDVLGFDAAVDYKEGILVDRLHDACPDGIDVYFDNVGGEILDDVLSLMKSFGRIPLCGTISNYNDGNPSEFRNFRSILVNRLKLQGFVMVDFVAKLPKCIDELLTWYRSGRLVFKEDVRNAALTDFPAMLNELFDGGNFGKLIIRL